MNAVQTSWQAGSDKPPRRDYLSFSALRLFASCSLHYYFRYLEALPEETVAASLIFGASFHSGVEFHFRELLAGNQPPDLDALCGVFWDSWRSHQAQTVQFGRGEDINAIGHLADRMFRAFQSSDFAHPEGTIIAVEEELRGQLVPGLPDLLARVDLIVDTGQELIVTDFKTSRSQWSAEQVDEAADQLLLYHELVRTLADDRALRLAFAVLTKTKTPELVVHPVPVDSQQIVRTKQVMERIWLAMQGGHYYPNPNPLKCPRCPYRKPCRAWTG